MDHRTLKILEAVIDEYIHTGEPVGSKTLTNRLNFKVSSATIRNEMALLEQLGFLEHPHTSAGRIPTFGGLRLYINKLANPAPLGIEQKIQIDSMLSGSVSTEQDVIQTASNALAEITRLATVYTNSSSNFSVIAKVEVIPTGHRLYVLLMVTSSGAVKNRMCRLEFDLTAEQIAFFANFIKANLTGLNADNLSNEDIQKLISAMGGYMMTLSPLLKAVIEMSEEISENKFGMSGERNLIACTDFSTAEVVQFLDSRKSLSNLLDQTFTGINVLFSKESDTFVISNSSLVLGSFEKNNTHAGTLGILGPMRLDYKKVIPYIDYFTEKVTDILSQIDNKEYKENINEEDNNEQK